MLEMLRVIREQEPPKPSTKLSTADGLPTLAANRGTEPAKLTKLVRGELDWIVMKALEKDRNRRYETANGFAHGRAALPGRRAGAACPPSRWYRLRKFARRNRRALAAATVAAAGLVAGVVGLAVYGVQQGRLARERAGLVEERTRFGDEQTAAVTRLEGIQRQTRADLYRALMSRSAALRAAREPGYRRHVWESLRAAVALDVPEKDPAGIRDELLACLGDPLGLEPVIDPPVTPLATVPVTAPFWRLIAEWRSEIAHGQPADGDEPGWGPDGRRRCTGSPPHRNLGRGRPDPRVDP